MFRLRFWFFVFGTPCVVCLCVVGYTVVTRFKGKDRKMAVIVNGGNTIEIVNRVVVESDGIVESRFDNMRSILLDMYWMGLDARAYCVSDIVSDMNDLGYENWGSVPQRVQARLMYDNCRFED